jgi:hypothetical protein
MWTNESTLRIDAADVVVAVDDSWNSLVGTHRVGALQPATVGQPLWETVANGDAHSLYEVMLERVRTRFRVAVDVRAVSREHAVRAELSLVLRNLEGEVELSLRILREQRRWTLPLFDPAAPRQHESVRVCDFCQRLLGFDWVEPEVALRQLRIGATGPQPRLHAAVCDDCERAIYAAANASRLGVA